MIEQLRSWPNQLTMLRLLFVPFATIAIVEHRYHTALAILVIAGVTDALDGLLARWLQQRTTLGQYLDPIADKLLLSTMFLVLSATGHIPWRVTILVFTRDVGILLVAAVLFITTSIKEYPPSIFGKANTVAQVLTVVLVLLDEISVQPWVTHAKLAGFWLVAALTIISALHYILLMGRRLRVV